METYREQSDPLDDRSGTAVPIRRMAAFVLAMLAVWTPCRPGHGQQDTGSSTNVVQTVSPARITLVCYMITREASLYTFKGSNSSVGAVLLINGETDSNTPVTGAVMELSELRDDTGKDLLEGMSEQCPFGRDQETSPNSASRRNWRKLFNLRTRFPAPQAKSLRTVKGNLVLTTTVPKEPIRINLGNQGKTFRYLGHDIAFSRVDASEKDGFVVTFACDSDPNPTDFSAWFKRATLLGSKGEKQENVGTGMRRRPSQPMEISARFKWAKDVEPAFLLLANEAQSQPQEYPFEYHDLPLPSLTAAYSPSTRAAAAANIPALPAARLPAGTVPLSELSPSTVTLAAREMPVEKVTEEIARATGIPLTFRKPRSRPAPETPRISVAWNAVPFWDALEDLCRKGNLAEEYYPTLDVLRGYGERPASQRPKRVVIGPVRLRINDVAIRTSSTSRFPGSGSTGSSDEMTFLLNGDAMVEPQVTIVSQGCQVDRCIAGSGVDLGTVGWTNGVAPPAWGPPHTRREMREGSGSRINFGISAPLLSTEPPDRIAHLRLYYYLKTYAKMGAYEIPDTSKAGKCLLSDGLILRWSEAEANDADVRLRLVFTREGGLTQADLVMLEAGNYSIASASGAKLTAPKRNTVGKEHVIECVLASKGNPPPRLLVSVPGGIKTYAAWIDFHDIDVPVLPAPAP